MPLNHGLYTDTLWSVQAEFAYQDGSTMDLTGEEYIAEAYQNGELMFTFRSSGAAANEGVILIGGATSGMLTFQATLAQHAAVKPGLYRLHLKRDQADDVWHAEATMLVGQPGDRETYLRFDESVFTTVAPPTGGSGGFFFDGGDAATDYSGLPAFDFGSAASPEGGSIDLGSAT
jgi:hypothetical protein